MYNHTTTFQANNYCVVKNIISNQLRDFITQYALFDEMQDFLPEGGKYETISCPNTHSKYGDPAMETLLLILQPQIEELTELTLYPTYSYFRVYRSDDKLIMHKDREACEISVSLCFNYSYNDSIITWPLTIENKKVILYPGDAVVYRGMEVSHGREPCSFEEDEWHVQGFFHFVDANGPHADFKFDHRPTIGYLPNDAPKNKYANL